MYGPTTDSEEAGLDRFYKDLQHLLALTPKTDVLFIIGDWNAQAGSQDIPGITGKFGLRLQNEASQRHWSQQTPFSNTPRDDSTHGHHQMVNTKIRLIILFAVKCEEALYSQQKQDQEQTAP